MSQNKLRYLLATLSILAIFARSLPVDAGSYVPAVWRGDVMSATLGEITAVITYSKFDPGALPFYLESSSGRGSLETNDYAANPLPDGTSLASYTASVNWTITFNMPVDDLLLYDFYWRSAAYNAGGPSPVSYTFDHPFRIASGNSEATISGNSLFIPDSRFQSGILEFIGSITSLSLTTTATNAFAYQSITLAINQTAIPEPEEYLLMSLGFGLIGWQLKGKRRPKGARLNSEPRKWPNLWLKCERAPRASC